jgi:hypothetical protein
VSQQEQTWMGLYRGAILELDLDKLPARICAARSAIEERLQALAGSKDSREERQALQDAQRNLRLLERNEAKER